MRYRCVECFEPAESLYTEYTTTTIKLSSCRNCNKNVDPYVEQGYVLIVLDCVLLRPPAYRHVLWNMDFQMFPIKLAQHFLICGVLRAYMEFTFLRNLGYAMTKDIFPRLILFCISAMIAQVLTIYFTIENQTYRKLDLNLIYRVSLAVTIPILFSLVTALVLVYEDTVTVQILGRILEFLFRFNAINALVSDSGTYKCFLGEVARILFSVGLRYSIGIPFLSNSWKDIYIIA